MDRLQAMPSGGRRETPGHQAAPCVPSSGFGFIAGGDVCLSRLLGSAPIVLGGGKPLFDEPTERINLKLVESRTFDSQAVLLRYEPTEQSQ
jgi:hypothetical protein